MPSQPQPGSVTDDAGARPTRPATTAATPTAAATPTDAAAPIASERLDWPVAGLVVWLIVGFYVDLWAHAHGRVDDTFLTPWHALLYSGAASFGVVLGGVAVLNVRRGLPVRHAVPSAYRVSFLGSIGFLIAGLVDMLWHSVFGFEADIASLLSPPHLALAASGVMMFSGPIRSVWSRQARPAWRSHGPALIGLAAVLAACAAFTQYVHPIVDPWAGALTGLDARPVPSQLFAMAPDGSGQRRITTSEADDDQPSVSPDGSSLAFVRVVDGHCQIFLSDPDGAHARQLTTQGNNGRPEWSPDGRRLGYVSDIGGGADIYAISADGADVQRLTNDPAADFGFTWSPDGEAFAFVSDRGGTYEIWRAAADGSAAAVQLTHDGGRKFSLDWSPDGSSIAYAWVSGGEVEIWAMASDGSSRHRLTSSAGDDYGPRWSPDGRQIAFNSSRLGDIEVYIMAADGSDQRNLSRSPGTDDGGTQASWSPDGSAILYSSRPVTPYWRVDFVREALGAAGILIQAALLAGFLLVALRHGPLPFGAITLLVVAPTALMTVVSDRREFLPGAVLAGLAGDLLIRHLGYGRSRGTDALIAFAVPALYYVAYFGTLAMTTGIGWTVHLWLGASILAGIIGLALNELMHAGAVAERSSG
jgi:Tol biopolymer transport system component